MRERESGFSLIELLIALAIAALVLAAASTFFVGVVKQYKVQSKITESNVEGVIGLELMRQDIESLGFGLPWDLNGTTYAAAEPGPLPGLSSDPPRAVVSVDGGLNNSDYLIIRSASVGMASAAGKWTTLRSGTPPVRIWGSGGVPAGEDLETTDRVIVFSPGSANSPSRVLVTPSTGAKFGISGADLSTYLPDDSSQTNIVYGIDVDAGTGLKRPFNRADYYIANSNAYSVAYPTYNNNTTPQHCASNTGVLVKAVMAHDDPVTRSLLPLLDCVADMQVVYGLDTTGTGGVVNSWVTTLETLTTAAQIRAQLVEIHLHILAQVGQRDDSYTYPDTTVNVGSEGLVRVFDFTSSAITNFRHYRWKVYNIVVKPKNLAN